MRVISSMTLVGTVAFLATLAAAAVPPGMAGSWGYTETGTLQFQNRAGTSFAKPSGSSEKLTINSDGTFRQQVLLQQSMYSCTTTLFLVVTGHVIVNGPRVEFHREGGHLSSKDNCHPRYNYEKQAVREVISFDGWTVANSQLLLTSQGKLKFRYKREN